MQLIKRFVFASSNTKVYYPFFIASDYTPLVYSPYYVLSPEIRAKKQQSYPSTDQTNTK
jgi:hypothetical protein